MCGWRLGNFFFRVKQMAEHTKVDRLSFESITMSQSRRDEREESAIYISNNRKGSWLTIHNSMHCGWLLSCVSSPARENRERDEKDSCDLVEEKRYKYAIRWLVRCLSINDGGERERERVTRLYLPLSSSHPARTRTFFFSFFFRWRDSSCVQSRPVHALFNDSWGGRSDSRREETHLNDDDDDGDATDTKKSMASPPLLPLNMNGCHPVRKQQQLLHTQRVLTCFDIY
jgi:hypothetical protein